MRNQRKFILSILCGGPSLERGISLNSARCVLDHLEDDAVEIVPFYFDHNKNSFKISKAQLYSNTPSDFDFKLKQTAKSLSKKDLIRELKKCDLCFPIIHGEMGEDGEIQKLLESENIPFIASPSQACNIAFHKFRTTEFLKQNGFYTIPSIIIKNSKTAISLETIKDFFGKINTSKVVVKPATGGSSIGVNIATSPNDVIKYSKEIFDRQLDTEVIVEPFIDGIEFTSIVLENPIGEPVSLIPIEIKTSYEDDSFFDFRKKYLPTHGTMYYQPPRFETKIISDIREQAEKIFKLIGLRDFARLDGWVLNTGEIFFSDINPISGMEQNSFLFQAGARINFSHKDLLHYIIKNACWRYKLIPPKKLITKGKKKVVNVLFGGATSERQVSLMSGTNIIFKLKRSKKYEPVPFLLDQNNMVWELPYSFILSHTVEEIIENIQHASEIKNKVEPFKRKIYQSLRVGKDDTHEAFFLPRKFSLSTFIKKSKFIFIGLHGGFGEDGTLQKMLEIASVKFNGPNSRVSEICMNKFHTGVEIRKLQIPGIYTASQVIIQMADTADVNQLWKSLCKELKAKTVIAKPIADGCSTGIVRLFSKNDLEKYISLLKSDTLRISANTFKNQKEIVELPNESTSEILFENFIETDKVSIKGTRINYEQKTGWIEITVGVVIMSDKLVVMNPSITIADGEVLSVEEKFQGGTGVNITPPPKEIIPSRILKIIKNRIGLVANQIGITGYSRIDAFVNKDNGDVSIIEINTLPGLTPSTVIFHQGLAEKEPIFPTQFIELLIKNKKY